MSIPRLLSFVALLAFSGASACSSTIDPIASHRRDLDNARARWSAQGPVSYEYVVANNCFCAYGGVSVRVVVTNGTVTSRTNVSTGEKVPTNVENLYRDVTGLFALIEDAIHRKAAELRVTYDAAYGYPSSVFIDYVKNAVDEEFGYGIESFTSR